MRLHERTGVIVGRTAYHRGEQAIVEFDDPTRCCSHPDCEAPAKRQDVVTFGLRADDVRAVEGARVVTYWMRGDVSSGLAGEVLS